jgi:glycosyltransferase involved in cell wall biosynthesis
MAVMTPEGASERRAHVALVHDWLTGMRGGERVLEALCERFPDAELFTLIHIPGSVSPTIERHRIHTSLLQHLPASRRYYRQYLPIFPSLVEHFDLDRFDLVVSSSHCVAKSAIVRGSAVHICYCHTPMRYAWDQFEAYFGQERLGSLGSRLMRLVMARLARWDRDTADRVTRYVTNSQHVAARIRRYYNRAATVVHPPVDTEFFFPENPQGGPNQRFALVVSALVPYKRLELAIQACRMAGVALRIAGDGPDRSRLEAVAAAVPGDVGFLGRVSDLTVRDLYRRAAVVLMPGEEDFGIVPLEAQACGTPVVALARGGALETVIPDRTGILADDPTPAAFADAIVRAMAHPFDRAVIRRHAEGFGRQRFGDQMQEIIDETYRAQGGHR